MNPKLQPGQQAPDFQLPDTHGTPVHLQHELTTHRGVVVMFLCNHCPYVQAYIPRLIQLQTQFGPTTANPIRFIGICSNDAATYPQDSFEQMKITAQQWRLNFPYLSDEDQAVARSFGAERTPEVFVLDAQGVCQYEGGIDDHYQDSAKVTQQPLRNALDAIAENRPVQERQTHAIGCTIKWLSP